jgi:hypothetical protein
LSKFCHVIPSNKRSKWASLLAFCSAAACFFDTIGFDSSVSLTALGVVLEFCIPTASIAKDTVWKNVFLTLWSHNKQLAKQESAVNNLKTKLLALETISATKATATAIAKATANIQEKNSQDEYKELRITNLEKNFKKYEQKTNEINNKIKNFQTGKTTQHQKNYKGDHLTESMDSLNTQTLSHTRHTMKQKLVDLTTDDEDETSTLLGQDQFSTPPRTQKGQRKRQRTSQPTPFQEKKSVHWKNSEVQRYDPNIPTAQATTLLSNQPFTTPNINLATTPLFFQQAPPPIPLLAPTPNPFHNLRKATNNTLMQNTTAQAQAPTQIINPFVAPNPFSQTGHNQNISKYHHYRQQNTRHSKYKNTNLNHKKSLKKRLQDE